MGKNVNKHGHIRKRGNYWEGAVLLEDLNGNKKRKYFTGKTQKEVREKISKAVSMADNGLYISSEKMTLESWLKTWLWEVKKDQIKPKTFGWYEELIRNHIKDTTLYKMQLSEIKRFHIQKWVDKKKKDGDSIRATNAAYSVIRNSMNDAIRLGFLSFSPASKIVLPKEKTKPIVILTIKEQETFLKAIENHRLKAAFYISLTTGIREGEIAALKWDDIDFEESILTINKNVIRINTYNLEGVRVGSELILQSSPKSDAGFRTIPLLEETIRVLKKHKLQQNIEKVQYRKLYNDNNLVFANEIGSLYDPKTFYTHLRKICTKTEGLNNIKFHALRHTFATRGLEAGIHAKSMQGILGHETIDMTMHYTHILDEQKKKEMDKLKDVFTPQLHRN